jgi:Cu+-exporting ATPase
MSDSQIKCYHCGDPCDKHVVSFQDKDFCCVGCKTVYEILSENDLSYYYDLESTPGTSPQAVASDYAFLDDESIVARLLEFDEAGTQVVSFLIPSIHCSSCIWVLENLHRLHKAVVSAQVNFPEKTVRITYRSDKLSLRELVLLLNRIGYDPYISLEDMDGKERKVDRSLIYKLGIAGFAFGNVMFLSFPEYFDVNEFWLERFKHLFRWLMFAFSVPVVLYSGRDYFISAFKGLRSGMLNIDVPIALGIAVLFVRSTIEIVFDLGTGFFDSLTGLVFFLLVGKFFQQKTYSFLSFERDYRSYFPIGVTRINKEDKSEEQVQVYKIEKGDRLLVRNQELIPVDAVLIRGNALIDYSFVTGESQPVNRQSGDQLFAGGRQQAGPIEVEVLKPVEQSYLTQLWQNEVFGKGYESPFKSFTDRISKRFTFIVLAIATVSGLFWWWADPSKVFNVITAVLIVACPCAIALSAPFTLGNLLRVFGRRKFYLKEASVIEQMAEIDTLIFDKTGTLTSGQQLDVSYHGVQLSEEEKSVLTSSLRASNHPLSRTLYQVLADQEIRTLDEFEEVSGKGIKATAADLTIRVGSSGFVGQGDGQTQDDNQTSVHISTNEDYKGCFVFRNEYRHGIKGMIDRLKGNYDMVLLSGDSDGEHAYLSGMMPEGTVLLFKQRPEDKLNYVKQLQESGKRVMMIGDGLNDAGALAQSDVGVAVSENINVFSPACDAILDAERLSFLPDFLSLSQSGRRIIRWSFLLSLVYNLIGLGFAVSGHLAPVVAAILMPLSSISIVVFTTLATQWVSRRNDPNKQN